MARMSCLLASSHVQLIYTRASALLVKAEILCIANLAFFMLQINVYHFPEGYCRLFHFLWPLGYVAPFEHIFPLTLLRNSTGLPNRGLSVSRLLVSLPLLTCRSPGIEQGPETTVLQAEGAPLTLTLLNCPWYQPSSLAATLDCSCWTRLVKIATVVRLSRMKWPIIPPLCQQNEFPQWKIANFEQYLFVVAPPPQSVLKWHIIPPMLQPQHSH